MPTKREILIGKLALKRQLVTEQDLEACIQYQEAHAPHTPLGQILVERGVLERGQLAELLEEQKRVLDQPAQRSGGKLGDDLFGKRVVALKLASAGQVNECVRIQEKYRAQGKKLTLGEILVAKKLLSAQQVKQVLDGQNVTILSCLKCGKNFNIVRFTPEKKYMCPACETMLAPPAHSQAIEVEDPPSAAEEDDAIALPAATSAPEIKHAAALTRLGDSAKADEEEIDIKPPQETDDDLCGQTIGGYKILKKVGQGGMGVIYKAKQISLDRIVAIKMLSDKLAANALFLSRFKNEAKSVAKFTHPNIVQIYDVGEGDGRHFFSMEYVQGENLGDILDRRGKIPVGRAVDITSQVSTALAEAANFNIVHRDIKPDNIILSVKGAAKLADLGIAKNIEMPKDMRITDSEVAIGTPYYISPEQAQNPGSVDCRADIYSLGASLYHMLTGRVPFYGLNPAVIFMKLAKEDPPDPLKFNPLIPYSLILVLRRMMHKDPAQRFQTPKELLAALDEVKEEIRDPTKRKPTLRTKREIVKIEAKQADTTGLELQAEEEEPDLEGAPGPPPPDPSAAAGEPRRHSSTKPRHPSSKPARDESTGAASHAGRKKPTTSRIAPIPGGRPSAIRPRAAQKTPFIKYAIVAIFLAGGAALGALLFGGGGDGHEKPTEPPKDTGPSLAEKAAQTARERLAAMSKSLETAATFGECRSLASEIGVFGSSLPPDLAAVASEALAKRDEALGKADALLVKETKDALASEAAIGSTAPHYSRALEILSAKKDSASGDWGRKEIAALVAETERLSGEERDRILAGLATIETQMDAAPDDASAKAIRDKAMAAIDARRESLAGSDASQLDQRAKGIDASWSSVQERMSVLARHRHLRGRVQAIRETLPALAALDIEAPQAALDRVAEIFGKPEHAEIRDGSARIAAKALETAGAMYSRLLRICETLTRDQTPFDFEILGGRAGERVTKSVKKYSKVKKGDGIVVSCLEPGTLLNVNRLSLSCYERLLGIEAPSSAPSDHAALALYLLATNPDRREEALEILRDATTRDASLRDENTPVAFALDLDLLEARASDARSESDAGKKKAIWAEVATRIETLRTAYAESGPEYIEAHAEKLEILAREAGGAG